MKLCKPDRNGSTKFVCKKLYGEWKVYLYYIYPVCFGRRNYLKCVQYFDAHNSTQKWGKDFEIV